LEKIIITVDDEKTEKTPKSGDKKSNYQSRRVRSHLRNTKKGGQKKKWVGKG